MHIFNIVDALIIKKIFFFLKKYKIFLIISSNFHPNELYKDGLQRTDFLPFIELIKKNFSIIDMNISTDYRRETLNQSKTYFTPINDETTEEFNKLFNRFVDDSHLTKIKVKSKIVSDGLNDNVFDVTDPGKHLDAKKFNLMLNKEETVCIDMRNRLGNFFYFNFWFRIYYFLRNPIAIHLKS